MVIEPPRDVWQTPGGWCCLKGLACPAYPLKDIKAIILYRCVRWVILLIIVYKSISGGGGSPGSSAFVAGVDVPSFSSHHTERIMKGAGDWTERREMDISSLTDPFSQLRHPERHRSCIPLLVDTVPAVGETTIVNGLSARGRESGFHHVTASHTIY